MDRTHEEESYYTSLWDATVWSEYFRGDAHAVSLKGILTTLLVVICSGLFLGSLLFCFGWLGRVTISPEGLKAPLYSGRRVFLPWQELQTAQKGSLGGWPCILVAGADSRSPLYLMVLDAKKRMIESVKAHAGATNVLSRYLVEHGV